jgi:hypothetical protein
VPDAEMAKWVIKQQVHTIRNGAHISNPKEKRTALPLKTVLGRNGWDSAGAMARVVDPSYRLCLCVERQGPWHRVRNPADSPRPLRAHKQLTIRGGERSSSN